MTSSCVGLNLSKGSSTFCAKLIRVFFSRAPPAVFWWLHLFPVSRNVEQYVNRSLHLLLGVIESWFCRLSELSFFTASVGSSVHNPLAAGEIHFFSSRVNLWRSLLSSALDCIIKCVDNPWVMSWVCSYRKFQVEGGFVDLTNMFLTCMSKLSSTSGVQLTDGHRFIRSKQKCTAVVLGLSIGMCFLQELPFLVFVLLLWAYLLVV